MASMNDLPRLLQEDPSIREDFLNTVVGFLQRHNIQVNPDEIQGIELNDDARGYLLRSPQAGSLGSFPTGGLQTSQLRPGGTVSIVWTTEGNSRSSSFWV